MISVITHISRLMLYIVLCPGCNYTALKCTVNVAFSSLVMLDCGLAGKQKVIELV